MDEETDFIVDDQGSVWTFEPISDEAKAFAEEHIEGWQWLGTVFVIDARIASSLEIQLESEGFVFSTRS